MHRFVPERQLVVDVLDHLAERILVNWAVEVHTKSALRLNGAQPASPQANKTLLNIM